MANAKEPPKPAVSNGKRHPLGESLTGGEREVDVFLAMTAGLAREAEVELEGLAVCGKAKGAHARG